MTNHQHAATLYSAYLVDNSILDAMRAELSRLALDIYVTGNTRTVTSAGKNGAQYTVIDQLPTSHRAHILRLAIAYCEAGVPPSNTSLAAF